MHPGSACCDLTQDLAGWIERQRARFAIEHRWARVLSKRGQRLRREAIKAQVRGNAGRSNALDDEAMVCSSRAMVIYQSVLMNEGHVDRVEAGHQWRLGGAR
jgi:hypothetical protein